MDGMKTNSEISLRTVIWLLFAAGAVFMALTGCESKSKSGFSSDEETTESYVAKPNPLKLVSIGVPGFDDEISRQWSAQRDGELEIEHLSLDEFQESETFPEDVDLVIHPSSIIVDLISRKLIRIFPGETLDDEKLNRSAFLQHFRKSLVRHNDKTWSISLGGQQLRLLYRKDILDAAGIEVPASWEELDRAIAKLKDVDAAKDMKPILVSTADGMASQMFMARAASVIRGRGKLTAFFDRGTMKPMIEATPFVNALEGLGAFSKSAGGQHSNKEVFAKFAAGEAVFAIAWPVASSAIDVDSLEVKSADWGVSRLPGSDRFYDLKASRWQQRSNNDETRVDLLGIEANNISITATTANARNAAEFVIWLTEKRNSQKLLQGVAAPFRATHLARIGQWSGLEEIDREFWDQYADSVKETHQSRIFLMFPQILQKRQYLKLLDEAIVKYLNAGQQDAKQTFKDVAQQWEALTDSLGREDQIYELRRGNGI